VLVVQLEDIALAFEPFKVHVPGRENAVDVRQTFLGRHVFDWCHETIAEEFSQCVVQDGVQYGGQVAIRCQHDESARSTIQDCCTTTKPAQGQWCRGIVEKFAANPVTGTGSLTVPIYTSPGRAGFGPQLSLSYDAGSGNGPFGFGWSLSLPRITRKTDKRLPEYLDA